MEIAKLPKATKPQAEKLEPVFITIKEFSQKMSISLTLAMQIARRKDVCDAGIAVNLTPNAKKGTLRVDWNRYYNEFVKLHPAVHESRRVK